MPYDNCIQLTFVRLLDERDVARGREVLIVVNFFDAEGWLNCRLGYILTSRVLTT